MFDTLRREWGAIRDADPGRRFEHYYESRHPRGKGGHPLLIIPGILVVLVGIVMLPAPGPGTLVIGFGLGLLARESRGIARTLDRAERKLRPLFPRWR